jgi:tRNA/rRNA methyltransferase
MSGDAFRIMEGWGNIQRFPGVGKTVPIDIPDDQVMAGGPVIVLVDTSLGENVGAVCRAMLNCGLTDLRLVRPCEDWNGGPARAMAVSAKWMLETVKVYKTVAEAIADRTHVFAATARPRDMVIPEVTARRAASEMRRLTAEGATVAVMFGAERTGLENEDVALADTVLTIPLNPKFSSLNLAQAVLLVANEWFQSGVADPDQMIDPTVARLPAEKGQLENFFGHLEQELDLVGFFPSDDMQLHMMNAIRAWVMRTKPTNREMRMLHGIIANLSGRRLGGAPARQPGSKGCTGRKARKRMAKAALMAAAQQQEPPVVESVVVDVETVVADEGQQ